MVSKAVHFFAMFSRWDAVNGGQDKATFDLTVNWNIYGEELEAVQKQIRNSTLEI